MSADKYEHEFRWESSVPTSVVVTGTFDDWKQTLQLTKQSSGKFSGKVPLEYDSKVLYKYVVDGNWQHNSNEPSERDGRGIWNNVLRVPSKPAPTAPGAPVAEPADPEPAYAPLSPVPSIVSAVVGAASALPAAAILAVTGKDLTTSTRSEEPVAGPSVVVDKLAKEGFKEDPALPPQTTTSTTGAPVLPPIQGLARTSTGSTQTGYIQSAVSSAAGAAIAAGVISKETGKAAEDKAKALDVKVGEVVENTKKAAEAEKKDEKTVAPAVSRAEEKPSLLTSVVAPVKAAAEAVTGSTGEKKAPLPAPAVAPTKEIASAPAKSGSTSAPVKAAPAAVDTLPTSSKPTPAPAPAIAPVKGVAAAPTVSPAEKQAPVPAPTKEVAPAPAKFTPVAAPVAEKSDAPETNGALPHINGNGNGSAKSKPDSEPFPTATVPAIHVDPLSAKPHHEPAAAHPEPPSTPPRRPADKPWASTLGKSGARGKARTPSEPGSPVKDSHSVGGGPGSVSEDSGSVGTTTPEGTPRKRKTTLFQKIRKTLSPKKSPNHRRASTAA